MRDFLMTVPVYAIFPLTILYVKKSYVKHFTAESLYLLYDVTVKRDNRISAKTGTTKPPPYKRRFCVM